MLIMTICIYCKDTLVPKGDTPDPKNPSLEHIVPWVLGGSNGCATSEVCTDCNSVLGRTVDSNCINHTLVAMLRQQFGISSYSGNVPDVVLDVRSTNGNEPARMVSRLGTKRSSGISLWSFANMRKLASRSSSSGPRTK